MPDFVMLRYVSVIEPLRAANRLSGRVLYRWSHISIDGEPAAASNGVRIHSDLSVATKEQFDYLFVCAGGDPALFKHAPTFAWLRQLARRGVKIGGVAGGSYILPRADLLGGPDSLFTGSMRRHSSRIIPNLICGALCTRSIRSIDIEWRHRAVRYDACHYCP